MSKIVPNKSDIISKYQTSPNDSGSVFVQIALLTNQISYLSDHLKMHRKDFSAKRSILQLVATRRKMLSYIKRNFPSKHDDLCNSLGIRIKKNEI